MQSPSARRASAPALCHFDAIDAAHAHQRTPPQDQVVFHIHSQVAKLELAALELDGRRPSLESQMSAPLAAPPPVSRVPSEAFCSKAPDTVPWPTA